MNWSQRTATALLALAAVAGALAPAAQAEAPPPVIRIGSGGAGPTGKPASLGTLGILFAKQFLEEDLKRSGDPVKVEWSFIRGAGPGTNEALSSGKIDVAYYGEFPIIAGLAGGLKVKVLASGDSYNNAYLVVTPDSTAKSIEDLRGKRIGLHRGRPWEFAFAQLLKSKGLSYSDFQIFNVPQADAQTVIASGNIDALFTKADAYAIADKNLGRTIWTTREVPENWRYAAALVVTEQFEKQYPTYTQKLVNAYLKAVAWLADPKNSEEAYRIWSGTGLSIEEMKRENADDPFAQRYSPLIDDFVVSHYKDVAGFMREQGMVRRPVDVSGLFEPRYVERGIKELGLESLWKPVDASGKAAD